MNESESLAQRIALCLPAATFEMDTFCRLVGIEASREIVSAAVEPGVQSRMLINPDFVQRYCQRDEHLFLLVMHEIWHILLGHSRLFPQATLIDNIAFDALINAGLTLQFPAAEYRGFFESINPADKFPNLLLRPPLGWPDNPLYPPDSPRGTCQIMERLYSPATEGGNYAEPLYEEIRDLLRSSSRSIRKPVILLGSHEDQKVAEVMKDPLVKEAVRRVVETWPPPPIPIKGRSSSNRLDSWNQIIGSSSRESQREFARLLRHCLSPRRGSHNLRQWQELEVMSGLGVLPQTRDRLHIARKELGAGELLWQQSLPIKTRINQAARAYVYFDVSGSMVNLLPHLIHLVLPYAARGEIQLYQFSGIVEPLHFADLQSGNLVSSRGTDINCVLEHIFDNQIRTAIILTDGCTGIPRDDYVQMLKLKHIQLHAVLPHESNWREDLVGIAASLTVLPSLD